MCAVFFVRFVSRPDSPRFRMKFLPATAASGVSKRTQASRTGARGTKTWSAAMANGAALLVVCCLFPSFARAITQHTCNATAARSGDDDNDDDDVDKDSTRTSVVFYGRNIYSPGELWSNNCGKHTGTHTNIHLGPQPGPGSCGIPYRWLAWRSSATEVHLLGQYLGNIAIVNAVTAGEQP